ncbi:MAG TPA: hypothetical protein VFP80_09205 [Thermoanaerobaculia bacterium]|nr:hypothetical protein [Thermoanaerobaculia bacterium]
MASRDLTDDEKNLVAYMLEELDTLSQADKLSDWEQEFVTSVDDQFGRYGRLSDKQLSKLKEVYERKTA